MGGQQDERVADEAPPACSPDQSAAELRQVVRAAERMVAAVEARSIALMLRLDLTMPQLRAVMTIRRLGRANGRGLSAALKLTPGAVVAICDHLERRGYVRRLTDTSDRRITWFELTEQGEAALKPTPAAAIARSRTKATILGLTQSEREGFIAIANAFTDALGSVLDVEADNRPEAHSEAEAEAGAGTEVKAGTEAAAKE